MQPFLPLLMSLTLLTAAAAPIDGTVIPLWPEGVPGAHKARPCMGDWAPPKIPHSLTLVATAPAVGAQPAITNKP